MVSNKKRIKYVLATIAATSAKTKEGALQPAVGVKVDSIGNGVEEFEGPGARRLMDEEQKGLLARGEYEDEDEFAFKDIWEFEAEQVEAN